MLVAMGNLVVAEKNLLRFDGRDYRCAVGRSGVGLEKTEGDGVTPVGLWPLRRVLYRRDRVSGLVTDFPLEALTPEQGWCDEPGHTDYNRQVRLPHAGSCENLWREDQLYDVIVVLGHNDKPVIAGLGSAIFLHVAHDDYAPTEGCVALARDDLISVLSRVEVGAGVEIIG
jgi:L,D-peptidoglycan transpeptidase YkuD (ErfK/YbiS/YcfS/YnhG family)